MAKRRRKTRKIRRNRSTKTLAKDLTQAISAIRKAKTAIKRKGK